MNTQLTELNQLLIETNIKRETYMRLFMDISAAYISKLSDYRKLVSRKIKANQTADLLKTLNTHKLEEEEAQMFYNRFDKAFMELYPGFVTELNKLLLPECQLEVPTTHDLTTEIRIFALMRLGVTDSQEIATLLHYSTQTIYNYKSGMRAKAINRDSFESDIRMPTGSSYYARPDHRNSHLCPDATGCNRQPGDCHPAALLHPDHL